MQRVRMESVNCLLIPIADIENNRPTAFNTLIDNKNIDLIIVRDSSQFHVYVNQCPHQGRRLDYAPGQFLSKSNTIICAAHGATFDLASGLCVQGPCRGESLIKLPAELMDGHLRIELTQFTEIRTSD
jgi:nitrite reductase/ring-hydroxylating ferredoxin subunit